MVRRENWLFLKVAVSPKPERHHPPKLVCMYVTSISTRINFWADSYQLNFLMTMEYIVHGSSISKTEEVPPIKIVVRACDINL